jgi:hypothetical protein
MRFLCLFTGEGPQASPSPEQMQQMGAYVEQSKRNGGLIATGGLKKRDADGFVVRRKGDKYEVSNGGAEWARAGGWAIIEASSREAAISDVKTFLGMAGDGVSEVIEISYM